MESKEVGRGPKVLFLHIEHGPESAERVWQMAKEADIVLIENIAPSIEEREELTKYVRALKEQPPSIHKTNIISRIRSLGDFTSQILAHILEEKKEIYTVDSSPGGPGLKENGEADLAFETTYQLFNEHRYKTSYESFKKWIKKSGESIYLRDKNVATQVAELLEKNRTAWQNKKIAVIQGLAHTRTYHYFKRGQPEVESSRMFPQKNISFNLITETTNQVTYGKPEIGENLLKRLYVWQFFILPAAKSHKLQIGKNFEIVDKFARSIDQKTIDQIFQHLERFENYLNGVSNPNNDPTIQTFIDVYAIRHIKDVRTDLAEKYSEFLKTFDGKTSE